jgi:protein tyrosine/serine phosphatase
MARHINFSKYGICYLAVVAIASALTFVSAADSLTPAFHGVSIKNFGKVDDNYYRGSQPRAEQFAQLKKLGIKTVIDLRKDSERDAPDGARSAGLQYFDIPLKSARPATKEQTAYFLSLVNNPANWPVYVHCKGGRHRTGAMTAVYRITHDGWTADQAYQEMKDYDFNDGLFGGPKAQKDFVYSFYQQFQATAHARQK